MDGLQQYSAALAMMLGPQYVHGTVHGRWLPAMQAVAGLPAPQVRPLDSADERAAPCCLPAHAYLFIPACRGSRAPWI